MYTGVTDCQMLDQINMVFVITNVTTSDN